MLYKGTALMQSINVGNRSINQAYKGNTLLWEKKQNRVYYKYTASPDIVIDLSKCSPNTYTNAKGRYVVTEVSDWSATVDYHLPQPISISQIKVNSNPNYAQQNASWHTITTALTTNGEYLVLDHDHGYGVTGVYAYTYKFDQHKRNILTGIRIYANCYYSYPEYCFGSIIMAIYTDELKEGTPDDYDFYEVIT